MTRKSNSPRRATRHGDPPQRASSGVWAAFALEPGRPAGWQLLIRISEQDGRATISELSILAGAHPQANGESVEFMSDEAFEALRRSAVREPIPQGGINHRLLRSIRLANAFARASGALSAIDQESGGAVFQGSLLGRHSLRRAALSQPAPVGGHHERTDLQLVRVAAAYLSAIQDGSISPRAEAARLLGRGWTPARVRDHLHTARNRGLLTDAPHGRAGGQLTPKGQQLLTQLTPKPKRGRRKPHEVLSD